MGQVTHGHLHSNLGVDSPFFSTFVLFKNQLFPQGLAWYFRKKDAWKEWKCKVPLENRKTYEPPHFDPGSHPDAARVPFLYAEVRMGHLVPPAV